MVGLVAACAYFLFKLVRIWQQENTTYYMLTKSLTVFDVLSLISLASCFVYGIIVWRDFGKGLKEAGELISRNADRSEGSVEPEEGFVSTLVCWYLGTTIESRGRSSRTRARVDSKADQH